MKSVLLLFISLFVVSSAWASEHKHPDRCYIECDQMLFVYKDKLLKQAEFQRMRYKQQFTDAKLESEQADGQIVEGLAYFLGYGRLLSRIRRVEKLAQKGWNEPLNDKEKQALNHLCHNGWDVGAYASSTR